MRAWGRNASNGGGLSSPVCGRAGEAEDRMGGETIGESLHAGDGRTTRVIAADRGGKGGGEECGVEEGDFCGAGGRWYSCRCASRSQASSSPHERALGGSRFRQRCQRRTHLGCASNRPIISLCASNNTSRRCPSVPSVPVARLASVVSLRSVVGVDVNLGAAGVTNPRTRSCS